MMSSAVLTSYRFIVILLLSTCLIAMTRTGLASSQSGFSRAVYVLPADVRQAGLTFAGVKIPVEREDVYRQIEEQLNFLLMDRRATMIEWFDRMAVYGPIIRAVLREEKISPDLIYLAVRLSNLVPNAKARNGGVGWWAIPGKEKRDASNSPAANGWDDRRDPVLSTKLFSGIYSNLLQKNRSDQLLAMCAYLDGADKIEAIAEKSKGFSYWDMIVPPNSESLIPCLVALKIVHSHRKLYGLERSSLSPLEFDLLDRLKLVKELPLHLVATWSDAIPRSIWELNPGVDPCIGILPPGDKRSGGSYPLRVPKNKGTKIRQLLLKNNYIAN
jgi:hypothetical protein